MAKQKAITLVHAGFEPFTEYAADPIGFFRDVLGIELWEKQEKIVLAVRDNPRVVVPACFAAGKTYLAAAIVLWWLYTRRPAMVCSTAPTGRQVKKNLWRNIHQLYHNAKVKLGGRLLQTELILAPNWQAFGFSGSSGGGVQGVHEAANVLFIEDESAAMDPAILEDFAGITAGEGARHLKIGNPVVADGPFYKACKDEENWVCIPISAFDVPNVVEKRTVIPGLIDWEWVELQRRTYGEKSPLWVTKVLGQFWEQATDLVIPVAWAQAALDRWDSDELLEWEANNDLGPIEIAVDVGMTIDETVITKKHGRRVEVLDRFVPIKTPVLLEKIEYWAMEVRAEIIRVDATGLGKTIPDMLEERILSGASRLDEETVIDAVVLGKRPKDKKSFEYALDEAQWAMRMAFDPDGEAPIAIRDPQLKTQLSARSWTLNQRGQIKADTKKDLKRKGIASPNDADAAMLHFHPKRQIELGFAA